MLSHFRHYYLLWMVPLLLILVCSGCSNAENHRKILGSWVNEAGVADGEQLPAGCIILTFKDDKRFEWSVPFSLETYTGKFSCRSKYIYMYFDKAMPDSEKKVQGEISFDGDNRMSLGDDQHGNLQFVRIGFPLNGSGNSSDTTDSSNTGDDTKESNVAAPPVAKSGNNPFPSPSAMADDAEKRTLEARKKYEEDVQKQQTAW